MILQRQSVRDARVGPSVQLTNLLALAGPSGLNEASIGDGSVRMHVSHVVVCVAKRL